MIVHEKNVLAERARKIKKIQESLQVFLGRGLLFTTPERFCYPQHAVGQVLFNLQQISSSNLRWHNEPY